MYETKIIVYYIFKFKYAINQFKVNLFFVSVTLFFLYTSSLHDWLLCSVFPICDGYTTIEGRTLTCTCRGYFSKGGV